MVVSIDQEQIWEKFNDFFFLKKVCNRVFLLENINNDYSFFDDEIFSVKKFLLIILILKYLQISSQCGALS